jgi:hypothetical protein
MPTVLSVDDFRNPDLAVAADRNPYIKSPAADAATLAAFNPDLPQFCGTEEQARWGNSHTHGLEGQNVLFLDGRVTFEIRAYCGTGNAYMGRDNVYLISGDPRGASPLGIVPYPGATQPGNEGDSILVHDPPVFGPVLPVDPLSVRDPPRFWHRRTGRPTTLN